MTDTLPHHLDRTIVIGAMPDVVFRFFTDNARWAAWWGAGSTIEPHAGGRILVRHPNGVEMVGEVLEITPPEHLAFTYGYASGVPLAPGESRVVIRLEAVPDGTQLHLRHEFAESGVVQHHVQGWRYQLSLFGNAVANEVHADAASITDRWFNVWSNPDGITRDADLHALVAPNVAMRDRFSLIVGESDLREHLAAVHRFMPGISLTREGDVRHCQGIVLADWVATSADGQARGKGTNVFTLSARNQVASVTGLWNQ
ncbi:MAG TPA: SRPBCC domain-containing protein [Vicinamibacterales bacterium]|nr:SRPBCC domain-containing protein [Vicinamibacterales bacterium]